MKKFTVCTIAIVPALVLLFASCAARKLETRLDPLSDDFYNKVRYIIIKEESKIFLELPPSARAGFIEEFWKRRDPTPGTESNEYKEAYFQRIEEANHLFRGGGRPGWLQDRGRIYILFGPPNERQTNPMGGRTVDAYTDPQNMVDGRRVAAGEKPTEIWVYYNLLSSLQKPHSVRLVFVDDHGTGDYKLSTNINEVVPGAMGVETEFAPNLAFSHELRKEEAERARLRLEKTLFDFSWELIKKKNKELGSNLLIHIVLPYKKISFKEEGTKLKAKMQLEILIKDLSKNIVWEFKEGYDLVFGHEFLEENKESAWEAEIPVMKWLEKGNHTVYIRLKNLSGDQEIEKLLPIKM
jgi:GWxTD domain-containing protein